MILFRLFILFFFLSTSGIVVFADDMPAQGTPTSYLYDLKRLIEKSRENIKEVNQKIKQQAVLKRNQAREERARAYYEKGVALTDEGKLNEARDYFEKAIRITEHPEMSGYIRESQRRLKKQESALQAQERAHYNQIKKDQILHKEDVEAAYKEAVALYKQRKYHPAKDAFEHVDEIAPDYRATGSYLKILDQDIATADALAAKQQALEIARQQKDAEAARIREKQMWLAQIAQKEKERKEAVKNQAQEVYDEAVALYKNKKFAEAKNKFEEVSWVIPDYKATMKYLARIDRDAQLEQERAQRQQQKALREERWQQEVERKKQEIQRQRELKAKEFQKKQDLQEQARFLYTAAVNLFNKKNMDEALVKFNEIEKLYPDFKSTRSYIARIGQWKADQPKRLLAFQKQVREENLRQKKLAKAKPSVNMSNATAAALGKEKASTSLGEAISIKVKPPQRPIWSWFKPAVVVPSAPAPVKAIPPKPIQSTAPTQISRERIYAFPTLEDQQKQARDIAALARKSAQLYGQIADVTGDGVIAQTKRKMAEVQRLLSRMRGAEAKKMYQDARGYFRSHDYVKAKVKFLTLEDIAPDYKATRRYLGRIEEEQKQAGREAVKARRQKEAERLKRLQDRESAETMRLAQLEQEKRHEIEQQQQAALQNLAQKASAINDDIIRLSSGHNYEAMKAKFKELENAVAALTALKNAMAKEAVIASHKIVSLRANAVSEAISTKLIPLKIASSPSAPRNDTVRAGHAQPVQSIALPAITVESSEARREAAAALRKELEARREAVRKQLEDALEARREIVRKLLESRREVLRKQLEDGVEAMYQEAVSLYKEGHYTAAADKFKDIQGILPGYKRSGQYMDEARAASLSISRQDNISKALDLFDSNVK